MKTIKCWRYLLHLECAPFKLVSVYDGHLTMTFVVQILNDLCVPFFSFIVPSIGLAIFGYSQFGKRMANQVEIEMAFFCFPVVGPSPPPPGPQPSPALKALHKTKQEAQKEQEAQESREVQEA